MIGYPGASFLDAGYFYCPYIPLQHYRPRTQQERRAARRNYLMQCPSHPYTCTGHCHTDEFAREVESLLLKEFGNEE